VRPKYFDWNDAKNLELKARYGVSFEEILAVVEEGQVLDNISHPNRKRYPNPRILVVKVENYAFLVPFVEDEEKVFLKTIYPSRKFTRKYLMPRRRK